MNSKDERDNHANQMNPNNDAYWHSRGYEERPGDWEDQMANGEGQQIQKRPHDASRPRY